MLKKLNVKPGDIVATTFGIYQHWSLVTDRVCEYGEPMLISATKRNGTVKEEPWRIVTEGKDTYIVEAKLDGTLTEILARARSQIGKWEYSVTERNCEHFVKWTTRLEFTSSQVNSGILGAATGITLVGILAEKPTFLKFLGGALAIAGVAVMAAKARERKTIDA